MHDLFSISILIGTFGIFFYFIYIDTKFKKEVKK